MCAHAAVACQLIARLACMEGRALHQCTLSSSMVQPLVHWQALDVLAHRWAVGCRHAAAGQLHRARLKSCLLAAVGLLNVIWQLGFLLFCHSAVAGGHGNGRPAGTLQGSPAGYSNFCLGCQIKFCAISSMGASSDSVQVANHSLQEGCHPKSSNLWSCSSSQLKTGRHTGRDVVKCSHQRAAWCKRVPSNSKYNMAAGC